MKRATRGSLFTLAVLSACALFGLVQEKAVQAVQQSAPPKFTEKSFVGANDLKVTVRMVGPTSAQTDLQIVCAFKHNPTGDKYLEAFQDFDDKLRGLLSALRSR